MALSINEGFSYLSESSSLIPVPMFNAENWVRHVGQSTGFLLKGMNEILGSSSAMFLLSIFCLEAARSWARTQGELISLLFYSLWLLRDILFQTGLSSHSRHLPCNAWTVFYLLSVAEPRLLLGS